MVSFEPSKKWASETQKRQVVVPPSVGTKNFFYGELRTIYSELRTILRALT